jgi:hypothetical protein
MTWLLWMVFLFESGTDVGVASVHEGKGVSAYTAYSRPALKPRSDVENLG